MAENENAAAEIEGSAAGQAEIVKPAKKKKTKRL